MSKDENFNDFFSPHHLHLSYTPCNCYVRVVILDIRKLVFCFQFHLILGLMMLKIHRTSRDLLDSSLYAYNLHEGKITWEILKKMRYFLCHRKYLPLTAAESLISLCVLHPFLGMLSVPGWYLCSRLQWVIYFLLTERGRIISRHWLLNCPDCFVPGALARAGRGSLGTASPRIEIV